MIPRKRWVGVLAALALAALGPTAAAQTKPFSIIGVGYGPQGINLPAPYGSGLATPHWAVGVGSYLGPYGGLGSVQAKTFDPATGSGTFWSGSPFVFVGADGDKLVCDYGHTNGATATGTYQITPQEDGRIVVEFLAPFVPTAQSTGKFKGVTGSWLMYAVTEPFVPGDPFAYAWIGSGLLKFKK